MPYYAFNTYIDNEDMIPVLLEYDWMVMHRTWTNCPHETYIALKKAKTHNGNAKVLS
tara:strand:- start:53 stop:223 length:171 start_codon:yes stop_codon:yes gene_type:complete